MYEFETLLHCFNDCSVNWHNARAHTKARRCAVHQLLYQLHSVEGRVQQLLNVMNSWLVHCWTRQ